MVSESIVIREFNGLGVYCDKSLMVSESIVVREFTGLVAYCDQRGLVRGGLR